MWQRTRVTIGAVVLLICGLSVAAQAQVSLQQAAQDGVATAQVQLGQIYEDGRQVPQDYAAARDWYEKAAAQGEAEAQNKLGKMLRSGFGGPQDLNRAFEMLRKAAASKTPQHLFDLAQMYDNGTGTPQDFTAAAALYDQAAAGGHVEAAVALGLLYQNGHGVAQDLAKARLFYEPAAQTGNSHAQNNLGLLYVRGEGVIQDYEAAFTLFQAAANSGMKPAMRNLSTMYAQGFGVPRNDDLAATWARLADTDQPLQFVRDTRLPDPTSTETPQTADALNKLYQLAQIGDPIAAYQLGMILAVQSSADGAQNHSVAAQLLQQAAEAGLPSARANLGVIYARGLGVVQDYGLAHMWLTLAALNGQDDIDALRTAIARKMTPDQITEAQKLAAEMWKK